LASIDIKRFAKQYGATPVLRGIDLHIADGEFVVLLGPSGCGKSTLLRMVAGLEEISAGELKIDGVTMNDVASKDRDVAMVFQNYALYPHMTAYDNIAFGLRRLRTPRTEIDQRVRHVAGLLGLHEQLDKKPRHLSGGQQQRVAMGRAMIKTPKVFLFDEPLSNLDATLREQLRVEIKKLHMLLKTTTLFVTHDQLEAMTLASRIVVLREGLVEQAGTPREIYFSPETLFVARFVGSPTINIIPVEVGLVGRTSIRLDAGSSSFQVSCERFQALKPQQKLLLGIRPRDIRPTRLSEKHSSLDAVVLLNETMGQETLMQVRVGGLELMMLVNDRDVSGVGSKIKVSLDLDSVHLFDMATEKSLDKRPSGMKSFSEG
jgi:multiple sugar transport system ATP-binding protein